MLFTYQRLWTAVHLILNAEHTCLLGLSKNRFFHLTFILLFFLLIICYRHNPLKIKVCPSLHCRVLSLLQVWQASLVNLGKPQFLTNRMTISSRWCLKLTSYHLSNSQADHMGEWCSLSSNINFIWILPDHIWVVNTVTIFYINIIFVLQRVTRPKQGNCRYQTLPTVCNPTCWILRRLYILP